jgi:hypothetical protein
LVEHTVASLIGQRVFGIALGYEDRTHPTNTPGKSDRLPRSTQAATAALDCWFAFQFQGSRSATLLAG